MATSLPSLATYIGSMPRSSEAPATAGCTGTAASRTSIATPEARASSLSTEATPPRVASRMQRSCGPAASSSASTAGHSERVSDSIVGVEVELAAREHDRGAVVADRAGEQDAVAGPGDGGPARARVATPEAGRADVHPVGVAALDDLRVAGDDATPAASAARAIAATSARSTSESRPSSSTSESVSASGRAPATARSLTVPLTASSPIEPPGKRSGLTT